jgi:hypothetical protein
MALALGACATSSGPSAPAPTASAPALDQLPTLTLQATIPTRNGTLAIVATPEAIWVLAHENPAILRIDPATNKVTATVALGDGFGNGLGLAGGILWTFHQTAGEVVGVDPRTAKIVATVPGGRDGDVFFVGDDSAWLIAGQRLVRIDDKTLKAVSQPLAAPCSVAGAAAAGGFVWLASTDGVICKVNPNSRDLAARGTGGGIGAGMRIVAGLPWVPTGDGGLVTIDPATASVATTVPPPPNGMFHGSLYAVGHPDDNAVVVGNTDGSAGWVRYLGGAIAHVVLTGTPKMELYAGFPPDTLPGRVVEAFGSLWVANFGAGTVERYALPTP